MQGDYMADNAAAQTGVTGIGLRELAAAFVVGVDRPPVLKSAWRSCPEIGVALPVAPHVAHETVQSVPCLFMPPG